MSDFFVHLIQAREVERNSNGHVVKFAKDHELTTFDDAQAFMDFVREHVAEFYNVVAFSDSDRTMDNANSFIESEMAKVEVV